MVDESPKTECSVCWRLYDSDSDSDSDSQAFEYTELEERAQHGCETCSIIQEGVEKVLGSISSEPKPSKLTLERINENEPVAQAWAIFVWPEEAICIDFYSVDDLRTVEPWDKLQVATHLQNPTSPDRRLDEAIDWLRYHLEDCTTNHPNCLKDSKESKALPKRLLDLDTGLPDVNIRLVQPEDGFNAPYMTLSHRWGHIQPITTTKGSISERHQNIKLEELPKTFQDAVTVTRKFGIKYLWIDSLCIVQDDSKDWETEASKMAGIYSGSYLNVAAVSSRDSNGGCIPESSSEYFKVERGIRNEHKSIYVRRTPETVNLSRAHLEIIGGWNPLQVPLLSRGWVYQERILSPRVAHFHKWDIFWECKSSLQCPCGVKHSRYSSSDESNSVRPELEQIAPEKLFDTWNGITKAYSELLLTHSEDKLPALSGIANLFSTHIKEPEYLAGIWKNFMPQSLLWHTNPNQGFIPNVVQKYQAPSWSWAAINYPIMMSPPVEIHKDLSIIDVWSHVPGNNPYGRVDNGCLKLRGLYVESPTLDIKNGKHNICLRFHKLDIHFRFFPDNLEECLGLDDGSIMPWTVVYIGKMSWAGVVALVLKQSDVISGSYVRIGVGETGRVSENNKWRKDEPMKVFSIV